MINKTDLEFTDISTEEYRTYIFPNGTATIHEPMQLNISKSGGHRVLDKNGISHYIPPGWIHLRWKAKEGEPNFVK